ncbi:Panacea domain-containing protein [Roseibium litorale]|uniref:SocA family protein n=1 Tax=Roseibium litorale TaxID=2803841 RepID=A0ABR9CRL6_9HYPH|nr:Panacea domain-containing protein [Roseibium litorale]MBD8893522.1 SocA family protein [Roseibium litorale]
MATSIDVAAAFVDLSSEKLSHLALQKYVYLAHMLYAGENNNACLVDDGPFQAWDYGPVSPKLYQKLRGFGSAPIPRVMLHGAKELQPAQLRAVQEVWNALSNATAARLVEITHDPRGAWAQVYQPGVRGLQIGQQEILDEFKRRSA